MFWNREKEIKRVLNNYGTVKGTALLTYFYSFIVESRKLMRSGRSSRELIPALTLSIIKNHNQSFFADYRDFFAANSTNQALLDELDRTGNKYYDNTIFPETPVSFAQVEEEFYRGSAATNDPVELLADKAKRIMQSRGLLNPNGSMPIVSGINYPDPFAKKLKEYCDSHYGKMGNKKVRSEYIITSFYSAICATLLYKKKELTDVRKDHLFYQLMSFVDMEREDVAAEHLLGTANGQPFAENIWSIVSSYISACFDVFDSVSSLGDDVILAAIRNAFTLGMLVGEKYSSGQYEKVLKLFVEEDIYKAEYPNDLEDKNCCGAVCVTGHLRNGNDGLELRLSNERTGDAIVRVIPIDTEALQRMMQFAQNKPYFDMQAGISSYSVPVYGKLINEGRWDSVLQCAFIDCDNRRLKQLKKVL